MSCADIVDKIAAMLRSRPPVTEIQSAGSGEHGGEHLLPTGFDCRVGDRVPASAVLEVMKTLWDPVSRTMEYFVRCMDPGDCVPFLIRAKGTRQEAAPAVSIAVERSFSAGPSKGLQPAQARGRAARQLGAPLVRAGQMATLLWERDGIRVVLPVICLDRGSRGDSVRVRVKNGSRVLHAEVESAGVLRASL